MIPERTDYETREESVPPLPSRKTMQRKKSPFKSISRRKKKKNLEFPLIRICLLLFFTIITAVATYPVWIEQIR